MNYNLPHYVAVLCLFALLLSPGCGGGGPQRGTVDGKVLFGGQPVSSGSIVFENVATGVAIMAPLAADGTFHFQTHEGAGLPVGEYRVAVTPQQVAITDENPLASAAVGAHSNDSAQSIPLLFHKTETSQLEATVNPGANSPFEFALP